MKRDMELVRKILFKIEETVTNTAEYDIEIDGYNIEQIAYHCALLNDNDLINDYGAQYGDNQILSFGVGRLTWQGHEFLDKIRSETVWNKTKETIVGKGLPMAIDVIKDVATAILSGMTQAALKNL